MSTPAFISILNDVLGPVMRGPSSSHTAGSHHIAVTARSLLGEKPVYALLTFDRRGSYSETYRQQNADKAFAAGLLGWPLTDSRFRRVLRLAPGQGLAIEFRVGSLPKSDHPNMVSLRLRGDSGRVLSLLAKSTGGGTFAVVEIDGRPVDIDGKTFFNLEKRDRTGAVLRMQAPPVYHPRKGDPLFLSAGDSVRYARRRRISLGEAGRRYEARILGWEERDVDREMWRRYGIMKRSIEEGRNPAKVRMRLLRPTAHKLLAAVKSGRLPLGGVAARAAAVSLSVMHAANSGAVVCAAPTGGSAGVIPGAISALARSRGMSREEILAALYAAGIVGVVFARRATFAAEIAGCQVEIGAAGAMAAAAVVEASGGSAGQACDAAAIALQNTMGSVCDLVQGLCEIPCHTRNAAAAASAFVCADLVLGGYDNPVPLDDTIDASLASGRALPPELRVTSRGGLAATAAARGLRQRRERH